MQSSLRVIALFSAAAAVASALNLAPFVDLSDLNTQWESFGSSSSNGEECVKSIERAKTLTADSLETFAPKTYSCETVKNLCSACSSCKTWTDGSAPSSSKKNCICANQQTLATVDLGSKDDCIIFSDVLAGGSTINAGAGDDCFIGVKNSGTSLATFNGGLGDDIFLFLNDDQPGDLLAQGNAGFGNDCIYFGNLPYNNGVGQGLFYAGDGEDFILIDTNIEPAGTANFVYFYLYAEGGNDLIVNKGIFPAYIFAGEGNDLFIDKDAPFLYAYLGEGNDKAIVSGSGARGYSVIGEGGDDEIVVRNSALVFSVHGGTLQNGPMDGDDQIYVYDSALVEYIYGGYGDDLIDVSANFFRVSGGDGDDTIIVDGDGSFVYGDQGDDSIFVYSGFHDIVSAAAGNNYIYLGSDARAEVLSGKQGDDVFVVDGRAQSVLFGAGNNHVEVGSKGSVADIHGLDAGVGTNAFDISGHVEALKGAAGIDNIKVQSDGVVLSIMALEGNDIINVEGRAGKIDAFDGDDVIFVSGEVQLIDAGLGDDSIRVSPKGIVVGGVLASGGNMDKCVGPEGLVVLECELVELISSSSSSSSSSS